MEGSPDDRPAIGHHGGSEITRRVEAFRAQVEERPGAVIFPRLPHVERPADGRWPKGTCWSCGTPDSVKVPAMIRCEYCVAAWWIVVKAADQHIKSARA